ncbi:MAG: hypothetical protein ACOY3Y_03600 [Acidobacteriota bacterium]
MNDTYTGILRPEAMLRTAQAEVNELKARLVEAAEIFRRLEGQVERATASFCAAVLQAGGEITFTRQELRGRFRLQRRVDPATHAVTFAVTREPDPPALEAVQ